MGQVQMAETAERAVVVGLAAMQVLVEMAVAVVELSRYMPTVKLQSQVALQPKAGMEHLVQEAVVEGHHREASLEVLVVMAAFIMEVMEVMEVPVVMAVLAAMAAVVVAVLAVRSCC
jgi:hypothetical protein